MHEFIPNDEIDGKPQETKSSKYQPSNKTSAATMILHN